MKKIFITLIAGLVGMAVMAQTNDYSNRSVRDPVQLQGKLNADMAATKARLETLEASTNISVAIATTAGITDTDADGASTISAIGYEANDAVLVLDADQGDDAADTWSIESEAADNDLSFVNGTTEAIKVTSAGVVTATDDFVCDKIIFTDASTAAPTNAVSRGFLVTVNGTNFWLGLYPVND